MSCFSFSISAPLRPMMMPGRDVRMVTRSLLPGPVHFDRAHAGGLQPFASAPSFSSEIFLQQLGVALLGEPARAPRLVEAQPESVRMNFLSHLCFFLRHLDDDMRHAPLIAVGAPHRRRADPLHARPFVDVRFGNEQLVRRPRLRTGCVRVGDGATAAPSPPWARCACWWCAAWSAPPRPAGRGSDPPPAALSAGRLGCIVLPLSLPCYASI